MLHHRDPAVVGGSGEVFLVLVDVAERHLLEVVLLGVDSRSDERVREARRFHRLVVAHQFHIDRRRDRRRADVLDLRVDADHIAAARERVGLDDLHATLDRRLEAELERLGVARQIVRLVRHRRVDVVVVREIAAEQTRARQIRMVRGAVEQRDDQIRLLAVALLDERQLRQRAAARVDLAVIDVGAEA